MVTGDQENKGDDDADTADAPGASGFVEIEPVRCTCEWVTADTGTHFYSRVKNRDPNCPVHQR